MRMTNSFAKCVAAVAVIMIILNASAVTASASLNDEPYEPIGQDITFIEDEEPEDPAPEYPPWYIHERFTDREIAEATLQRLDIIVAILLAVTGIIAAIGFCYIVYRLLMRFF
jgi:hypothetical protein